MKLVRQQLLDPLVLTLIVLMILRIRAWPHLFSK